DAVVRRPGARGRRRVLREREREPAAAAGGAPGGRADGEPGAGRRRGPGRLRGLKLVELVLEARHLVARAGQRSGLPGPAAGDDEALLDEREPRARQAVSLMQDRDRQRLLADLERSEADRLGGNLPPGPAH